MNLLDNITKLASVSLENSDYELHALLTRVATDLAFVETNRYFIKQFKKAQSNIVQMQKELAAAHMHKMSRELDVIARDIENKVISFSREDPIESVLDSYKLIHKIARTEESSNVMKEILDLSETMPEEEFIRELETRTLGMSLNDKKNILYVLDKDRAIEIPLERIAKSLRPDSDKPPRDPQDAFIANPKDKEELLHNKKILKKVLKEYSSLSEAEREDYKLTSSFPSEPYVWSGFAYQTTTPYQQSSQLNFWSLASNEEEMLNKIAKRRK